MGLQKMDIRVSGVAPLLMHNIRLANPLDPFARRLKVATKKKKGEDPDEKLRRISRIEWEGGLYYFNSPGHALHGPMIPGYVLRACIRDAARISRGGKEIERGLSIKDTVIRLDYDGPRDIEEMWTAGQPLNAEEGWEAGDQFIDQRMVTVARAKVLRTRPKFSEWSFTTTLLFNDKVLGREALTEYLEDAGMCGRLCDGRGMGFGQFEVECD